jgi:hypothetical protein
MSTMTGSEFHNGEHDRKEHPFEGFAVFHRGANSHDDQPAAVREQVRGTPVKRVSPPSEFKRAYHVLAARNLKRVYM